MYVCYGFISKWTNLGSRKLIPVSNQVKINLRTTYYLKAFMLDEQGEVHMYAFNNALYVYNDFIL